MNRTITVIQSDEACGWFVIEDGKVAGGFSTDEALAHVAALMLRDWAGFAQERLSDAASALMRERLNLPEQERAEDAT